MDFSKWPEKRLRVTNILLDPLNPRIPPTDEQLGQRTIIAHLVYHDKVDELARSIADNGYFPTESLIAVKQNGKTVVIEGNRRLAALKLLLAPETAPEDRQPRFRTISRRADTTSIRKVRLIVAPSREAAAPIIMSRHTKPQVESWKPIMKASFYHRLLEGGLSIEDLSNEYNVPASDILGSLRLYTMYNIACTLELPEDVSKLVHNPREFNVTTLQRLYVHKVGMDFLGVKFDDSEELVGGIHPDEFKKGYKKIVTDIATRKITSRTLDKTKDIKKYLDAFSDDDKPNLRRKGSFTSRTLLKIGRRKAAAAKRAPRKKPKRKPRGLIPRTLRCNLSNQRISDVYDELRTLSVADYPNSTAVLFRSLLEMALSHYLDGVNELRVIIEQEKQKRAKKGQRLPRDWHPTLRQMMNHLVSPKCEVVGNPNIIKVLHKFLSEKDELLSQDSLNFFVHNPFYSPNEDSLRRLWNQLEGLFQIILVEPEKS